MRLALLILATVVALSPAATAAAQAPPALPVPNGPVGVLERTGDRIVVAGDFTALGPHTGGGAEIEPGSGQPRVGFPRAERNVNAAVGDGSGGWYVGGDFPTVDGVPRVALVHVLADGRVDPGFDPRVVGGSVTALALAGGRLYVAGFFTSIGGRSRSGLAALDPTTGSAIDSFDAGVPAPQVHALAVDERHVYVGGEFTRIGGADVASLAALDPATGRPDPAFDADVVGAVRALLLHDGRLYLGGDFGSVGGRSRHRLAAVDPGDGAVTGFDPSADRTVSALAAGHGRIYAGGDFETVGGVPRTRIAAVDPVSGAIVRAFTATVNRQVRALATTPERVLVGGWFDEVSGERQRHLAALDPRSGAVDPLYAQASGTVHALVNQGDRLFAGGELASIGGERRDGVAAFDARTGLLDPTFGPPRGAIGVGSDRVWIAEPVGASGPDDEDVPRRLRYATLRGGFVSPAESAPIIRLGGAIAAHARGACVSLRPLPVRTIRCFDRDVRRAHRRDIRVAGAKPYVDTIAASGARLYVAGRFTRIAGARRRALAAVDVRTGRIVRRFRAPRALDTAEQVVPLGRRLYVVGRVGRGKQARDRLLELDARTGRRIRGFREHSVHGGGWSRPFTAGGRLWLLEDDVIHRLGRRGASLSWAQPRPSLGGDDVVTAAAGETHVFFGGGFGVVAEDSEEAQPQGMTPGRPFLDAVRIDNLVRSRGGGVG